MAVSFCEAPAFFLMQLNLLYFVVGVLTASGVFLREKYDKLQCRNDKLERALTRLLSAEEDEEGDDMQQEEEKEEEETKKEQ